MKHFYLLRSGAKALCLLALVAFATTTAKAELLLNEDFDYTVGNLYNQGGWVRHASQSNKQIQVVDQNLTFSNYQENAVGKMVKADCGDSFDQNEDLHRPFTAQTTGTVYASALVNFQKVTGNQFFLCLDGPTASANVEDGKSPANYARLFVVKSETEGKFKFGLGRNSTAASTSTSDEYDLNTTYLIILKYEYVSGDKNDVFSLFVNSTDKTEPTTPLISVNSGTDYIATINEKTSDKGIGGVCIMQNGSSSNPTTPSFSIDAIRVATAWADLFPASSGEGDGGETAKTPEIKSSEDLLFGGNVFLDETYTATFTVSGKNLKGDITLESDNSEVTLSHSTIAQADAEAEGGVTVTATLKPVTTGAKGSAGITLKSDGASDVVVAASWAVVERTKVATIAKLKEAEETATNETILYFTGEAVVTYAEKPSYTQFYYIEDATGAVRLDEVNAVAIESGDKIKDFAIVKNEDQTHSFYILTDPTIVSKNNELTPQVVTLETLSNNGADYFWELVKVEDVTLDKTDAQYIAGQNKISQGETTINLNLTSDNTLVGTDKPTKADVVGISYFVSGGVIRARSAADVTAKPEGTTTAIATTQSGEMLCYSADGMLHIDNATSNVAIYSLTGICVVRLNAAEHIAISLPQGIYAVKTNGATTKVVVK